MTDTEVEVETARCGARPREGTGAADEEPEVDGLGRMHQRWNSKCRRGESATVGSPDTLEAGRLQHHVSEWQQLISDPFIVDMVKDEKNSYLKCCGSKEPRYAK